MLGICCLLIINFELWSTLFQNKDNQLIFPDVGIISWYSKYDIDDKIFA